MHVPDQAARVGDGDPPLVFSFRSESPAAPVRPLLCVAHVAGSCVDDALAPITLSTDRCFPQEDFSLAVLWVIFRALNTLGKCCATDLNLQCFSYFK